MTAMTLDPPVPVPASRRDDAARIERWAAAQRADLTRLTLAQRRAEADAVRAEQSLAGDDGLGGGSPIDVLSVIDARLAKATSEAEQGVESARREVTLVLSAAAQAASTMLREAGLDSAAVLRSTWRPPEPATHRTPPRSAEDLWQEVMAVVSTNAPSSAPDQGPSAASRAEVAVPSTREHNDAGVADDEASEGSDGDAAQVYDLFWAGVPSERPSRERLRRRTERGGQ